MPGTLRHSPGFSVTGVSTVMLIGLRASHRRLRHSWPFVVAGILAACGSSPETPKNDGGITDGPARDSAGDGGGSADDDKCAGTTSNEAGPGDAWTAMPLINDTSTGPRPVTHIGADFVTGIYYESPDKGLILTADDGSLNSLGGAVFKATGSAVTSVAFSGDNTGIRHSGTVDFVGVERTPTGYIAMAYANEVIASHDGGATFMLESNAAASRFSIDRTLAYRVTTSGTTMVLNNGVIAASTAAPGPTASYDDIWSSSGSNAACKDGPHAQSTPTTSYSVHISPDRQFVAYTAAPDQEPTVCISTDGGRSFTARPVGVTTSITPPIGVIFMTKKRGLAWFGSGAAGSAYIKRTTDGGVTWTTPVLPGELATNAVELQAGYVGTDCMHAWLAGYDLTADKAVLLASSDGGVTWTKVAGISDVVAAAGGSKLYSVFALDTAHVWIGGSRGVIVHN